MALIPAEADGPGRAGRAPRGDRPQPRGAAGAEARRAAGADPARRGLLLRRDRRDHRLQPDQDQPLPGRGARALPQPALAQRGRQPLRRAAAAALRLLRRRGERRGGGDAARAPARLRRLPRDDARLPGGAAGGGRAGAGAAGLALAARARPRARSRASHSRLPGAGRRRRTRRSPRSRRRAAPAAPGWRRWRKLLAICAGTAGGAAACVATGVVPAPLDLGARPARSSRRSSAVADRLTGRRRRAPCDYEPAPAEAAPEPRRTEAAEPSRSPSRRRKPRRLERERSNTRPPPPRRRRRRRRERQRLLERQRRRGVRAVRAARSLPALRRRRCASPRSRFLPRRRPPSTPQPATPATCEVDGGEDSWHAEHRLHRRTGTTRPGSSVAAVHYRVRDPTGHGRPAKSESARAGQLPIDPCRLTSRNVPGAYTAEVWLRGRRRRPGPDGDAKLRFDDVRPGDGRAAAGPGLDRPRRDSLLGAPQPSRRPQPSPASAATRSRSTRARRASPCAAADRCTRRRDRPARRARRRHAVDRRPARGDELRPRGRRLGLGDEVRSSPATTVAPRRHDRSGDRGSPACPSGWTNRPVTLTATATDAPPGWQADGAGGPFTAIRVDGGVPTDRSRRLGERDGDRRGRPRRRLLRPRRGRQRQRRRTATASPTSRPRPRWCGSTATPPAVAFANSQDPDDPELIEARVSDPLSGPDPSRGWIAVRRAGSGDALRGAADRVGRGGQLRARWDSDAYPAGEYEFRATGYDAAGNAATTDRRANGADGAGQPAEGADRSARRVRRQDAGLAPLRAARRAASLPARSDRGVRPAPGDQAVPYGRGVLFSGRLIAALGSPLARMPVRIVERFDPGAEPAAAGDDGRDRRRRHLHRPPRPRAQPRRRRRSSPARGR